MDEAERALLFQTSARAGRGDAQVQALRIAFILLARFIGGEAGTTMEERLRLYGESHLRSLPEMAPELSERHEAIAREMIRLADELAESIALQRGFDRGDPLPPID